MAIINGKNYVKVHLCIFGLKFFEVSVSLYICIKVFKNYKSNVFLWERGAGSSHSGLFILMYKLKILMQKA